MEDMRYHHQQRPYSLEKESQRVMANIKRLLLAPSIKTERYPFLKMCMDICTLMNREPAELQEAFFCGERFISYCEQEGDPDKWGEPADVWCSEDVNLFVKRDVPAAPIVVGDGMSDLEGETDTDDMDDDDDDDDDDYHEGDSLDSEVIWGSGKDSDGVDTCSVASNTDDDAGPDTVVTVNEFTDDDCDTDYDNGTYGVDTDESEHVATATTIKPVLSKQPQWKNEENMGRDSIGYCWDGTGADLTCTNGYTSENKLSMLNSEVSTCEDDDDDGSSVFLEALAQLFQTPNNVCVPTSASVTGDSKSTRKPLDDTPSLIEVKTSSEKGVDEYHVKISKSIVNSHPSIVPPSVTLEADEYEIPSIIEHKFPPSAKLCDGVIDRLMLKVNLSSNISQNGTLTPPDSPIYEDDDPVMPCPTGCGLSFQDPELRRKHIGTCPGRSHSLVEEQKEIQAKQDCWYHCKHCNMKFKGVENRIDHLLHQARCTAYPPQSSEYRRRKRRHSRDDNRTRKHPSLEAVTRVHLSGPGKKAIRMAES